MQGLAGGVVPAAGSDGVGMMRPEGDDQQTRLQRSSETRHHNHEINPSAAADAASFEKINVTSSIEQIFNSTDFWQSLDLEGEIPCGYYKCLFRPKSIPNAKGRNADQEPSVAYLIGSNRRGYQFEAETKASSELARYLQTAFHAKHLYLGPPRKVKISPEAARVYSSYSKTKQKRMYWAGKFATVQKVRIAPEPHILVKANRRRENFKQFIKERVANRTRFAETLADDVASTLDAVEAFPLLAHDFQILIDTRGNVYQFDLERVFLGGIFRREDEKVGREFSKAYDESLELLRGLAKQASRRASRGRGHGNKFKPETPLKIVSDGQSDGEAVLEDYMRNFNSLSCRALGVVNGMSGRREEAKKEMARTAKLMMVHVIQRIMFGDEAGQYGGPTAKNGGPWNCSL